MRTLAVLLLAIASAVAAWWWFTSEMPKRQQARAIAAEAAARQAEQANSLYRWRDDAGNLQITEAPPSGQYAGRKYERISRTPEEGIQVDGQRD